TLGPTMTLREFGKATGSPCLINPGVFVIVVLRPPDILCPAHDDPVRVDVLHVRGETAEPAAGDHHVLIEQEPTEEIELLSLGIEPRTQAAGNLPLGVDCRGIAEPHVARGGIGSNVLERAGSPFEGMELTRCQPARPYDGAPLIDVFGGRAGSPKGAEIGHHPVLPSEGMPPTARGLTPAHDDSEIIDCAGLAVASAQRAKTSLPSVGGPAYGTHVARAVEAVPDYDAIVIDVVRGTFIP